MRKLDVKDKKILEYIKNVIDEKGYSPTVREIGEAVGLKSPSSIYGRLTALNNNNYIEWDKAKPRTITVTQHIQDSQSDIEGIEPIQKIMSFPLLGNVAAGLPILSEENLDEYINIPYCRELEDKPLFFLKVRGESMINIGILPGDKLLVEKTETAENGEIVVAYVEDRKEEGITVKKFYKENGHYRLQPENDTMEPIIANNVTIVGKVRALMRSIA